MRSISTRVSVLTLALTCAAWAQRPLGADYSHWNGDITPAQWATLYSNGWVFGWTKATESPYCYNGDGTGYCGCSWYLDNTFVNNMTNARNAGVLIGCYHFAHPQCYTAAYEAEGFVSRAGGYISGGFLRPALDLEDGASLGATALSAWVNAFCDRVEALTGVEPIVYTNSNYASHYLNSTVAGRDLWVAEYWTSVTPNPQTDHPSYGVFNNWAFWQYTSGGSLPGLSGSHDLNVFNGTFAGLQALVISGTSEPPYIVESRSSGQHYSNYSEVGSWSDASIKSTAPGVTSSIGSRWCTIGTAATSATFRFTPTTSGTYEVFTTNCTTSNSGNPLIHRVTHAGGTASVSVCQNTTCTSNAVNVWYSLGQYSLIAGTQYNVTLDAATTGGSAPSGNAGRSDAIKWMLVSSSQPPSITQHPSSQTVAAGGQATFSMLATGGMPMTYRWQKNGTNLSDGGNISGATTPSLQIASATSADQASYRCVVTNAYGSATTNAASLTVTASTADFIVESRSGGQHFANYAESGSWSDASGTIKSTAAGCTAGIGSRWCVIGSTPVTATFSFTPSTTGAYEIFTTNCNTSNSGNPLIHKVNHAGGQTSVAVCQNSTCTDNAVNRWYSLGQYTLNTNTVYSVVLDGSTAAGSAPASNAGRSDAIKWVYLGSQVSPPTIAQEPTDQNLCAGGTVTFSITATGAGTLSYRWQKNGVDLNNGGHYAGATASTLTVSSVDASDIGLYGCAVTNTGGTTASSTALLSLKPATSISQQPAAGRALSGGTVTFNVVAVGDGALTYRWQKNGSNLSDGGHYSGTSTDTLTVSNCNTADVASYRCMVTGGCGTATSSVAGLSIAQAGDFDADNDVDQEDFGMMQTCLLVMNPAQNAVCWAADLNHDGSVDAADMTRFTNCISGPQVDANPSCNPAP